MKRSFGNMKNTESPANWGAISSFNNQNLLSKIWASVQGNFIKHLMCNRFSITESETEHEISREIKRNEVQRVQIKKASSENEKSRSKEITESPANWGAISSFNNQNLPNKIWASIQGNFIKHLMCNRFSITESETEHEISREIKRKEVPRVQIKKPSSDNEKIKKQGNRVHGIDSFNSHLGKGRRKTSRNWKELTENTAAKAN